MVLRVLQISVCASTPPYVSISNVISWAKKLLINQTLSLFEKEGYLMKVDNIEIQAMMAIEYIIITLAFAVAKNKGYTPRYSYYNQSCWQHIILPRIFAGVFLA